MGQTPLTIKYHLIAMKHKPLISAVLITLILAVKSFAGDAQPADACVYGGSSGGVVAAVQAARMGKRVVLVEPGRHLGGMMAGGLSRSDVGSTERAKLFGGLAREVFERIGKHYGQDPGKVFEIAATEIKGRSRGGVGFIRQPSTPSTVSPRKIVKPDSLPGIVMDGDEAEYEGNWAESSNLPALVGPIYHHDGNKGRGEKSATFTATIPETGDYEIRLLYTWSENRSTRTKVTVTPCNNLHSDTGFIFAR